MPRGWGRALWVGCFIASIASIAGCVADTDEVVDDDPEVGELESNLTPADAESLFLRVLGGETDRRSDSIRALKSAVRQDPDNPRLHLLLGLARLSAVAEDNKLTSLPFIDGNFAEVERLDPSDRRIPGWRVPLRVQFIAQPYRRGVPLLRGKLDERMAELEEAAEAFPQFVGFSAAMMMSPLPHDTGYPAKARKWADLLSGTACTPEFERFCGNTTLVPHNIEGMRLVYGDVYAKAGDVEKAKEQYALALAQPTAAKGTWRYYELARERHDDVVERVARWNDADAKNDPDFFFEGKTACVGCHGK